MITFAWPVLRTSSIARTRWARSKDAKAGCCASSTNPIVRWSGSTHSRLRRFSMAPPLRRVSSSSHCGTGAWFVLAGEGGIQIHRRPHLRNRRGIVPDARGWRESVGTGKAPVCCGMSSNVADTGDGVPPRLLSHGNPSIHCSKLAYSAGAIPWRTIDVPGRIVFDGRIRSIRHVADRRRRLA